MSNLNRCHTKEVSCFQNAFSASFTSLKFIKERFQVYFSYQVSILFSKKLSFSSKTIIVDILRTNPSWLNLFEMESGSVSGAEVLSGK